MRACCDLCGQGRSKASEMLFLGKKFTAEQAYVANLISEVLPRDRLLPEVGLTSGAPRLC